MQLHAHQMARAICPATTQALQELKSTAMAISMPQHNIPGTYLCQHLCDCSDIDVRGREQHSSGCKHCINRRSMQAASIRRDSASSAQDDARKTRH